MPIDNKKMLYFSFDGKQYSDNPKYICDHYQNHGYKIVWAFNDIKKWRKELPCDYQCIKRRSWRYMIEFATSKLIVTNDYISSYMPIRRGQVLLNTWHGGSPLKTVGKADEKYTSDTELFFKIHEKKYTAILSSSKFMTAEVFDKSLGLKGCILEYGMPRNDIFFVNQQNNKDKVYGYLGIEKRDGIGLVMYAPTFRDTDRFIPERIQLNVTETVAMLKKRFKKDFVFVFRAHHRLSKECFGKECLNASDYPNMQELLVASDVLITDYSSCMGDFAFTKRPIFLYVPDLEEYMKNRGFYWDIYGLPFHIAKTQEELSEKIMQFDEERYQADIDEYFQKLGTFERGNATQLTCDWIDKRM